MIIIQILKSIFFLTLSLITIFRCYFKKKKNAQFIILKEKNKNLIDNRLKIYQKNNKNNNFVNFLRGQSFFGGLKIYFKIDNVIFFNHIFNVLEFIQSVLGIKQYQIKKNYIFLLNKIIRIIKIENFYTIDDYRNIKVFSEACKLNKVKLYIYQHGRISINLKYQKSLKNLTFEKYFVWNKYSKKKLMYLNKKYQSKKIVIINKLSFLKKTIIHKTKQKNILIIQEDLIKRNSIIELINLLKKLKNKRIYFKFRPNNAIDQKLENFLFNSNIRCFHKENIYEIFKKFKINFLLASNSSLLLESSYFLIYPVLFYEKKPILKDFIKDKVVFHSSIRNINSVILNLSKTKNSKLKSIKKNVWGN